jgi:ATP-dependent HslUV protease ATP-binding subunit HslU
VLDALVGQGAGAATRESFRKKLRNGELGASAVEIDVEDTASPLGNLDIPGQSNVGVVNIGEIFGKAFGRRTKRVRMTVDEAYEPLVREESDKLVDQDALIKEALTLTAEDGIVFLDEIDKIASRSERVGGGDVSREGVQRDLLPLIEGTIVNTKHGPVKTDHILFVASGAFHVAKPSDLLPELQGRLPIRVELKALTREDFRRILTEPEASLVTQYKALLLTEGVTLDISDDAVEAIAGIAADVNSSVENIGARRLQTVMERLLDEISYSAPDRSGETVRIDAEYVRKNVGDLAKNADLSRFIL